MSYPVYGRFQTAEPLSALADIHQHDGTTTLKVADHETPLGVLDQSDLIEQGIHTSRFIPGCRKDAEALGSCTANTFIEAAAKILPLAEFVAFCKRIINHPASEGPKHYGDTAGAERAGISFYHVCSDQTGIPSEEWPPTDCGSSGPYIYSEALRLGVISGQKIASAGESLASLMQSNLVLMGARSEE